MLVLLKKSRNVVCAAMWTVLFRAAPCAACRLVFAPLTCWRHRQRSRCDEYRSPPVLASWDAATVLAAAPSCLLLRTPSSLRCMLLTPQVCDGLRAGRRILWRGAGVHRPTQWATLCRQKHQQGVAQGNSLHAAARWWWVQLKGRGGSCHRIGPACCLVGPAPALAAAS